MEYAALGLLSLGILLAAAPTIAGELSSLREESSKACVLALESAIRSAAAEAAATGRGRSEAFLTCEVRVSGGGSRVVISSGEFSRELDLGLPVRVEGELASGSIEVSAERSGGGVVVRLGG